MKNATAANEDFGGYINLSMWDKYMPTIQMYIKGFMYALLVLFNIKMIIWMVRGSTPIKDSSGNTVGGRSS